MNNIDEPSSEHSGQITAIAKVEKSSIEHSLSQLNDEPQQDDVSRQITP